MSCRLSLPSVVLAIVAITSDNARAVPILGQSNETFDNSIDVAAHGWTGLNNAVPNNGFGFSASNNTGGTPGGEAGGAMARNGVLAYYADTTLLGTLVENDVIEASGEFDITSLTANGTFDNLLSIGHFDSTLSGALDFVGFEIAEINATSVRMCARLEFGDAVSLLGPDLNVFSFPNSDRLWSYTWDPTGNGTLTFTIDGPGGGNSTIVVGSAHTFNLDAFGLLDTGLAGNNNTATLFIDNAIYTSHFEPAVPEPSTLVLGLGGIGLAVCARRRKNGQKKVRKVGGE